MFGTRTRTHNGSVMLWTGEEADFGAMASDAAMAGMDAPFMAECDEWGAVIDLDARMQAQGGDDWHVAATGGSSSFSGEPDQAMAELWAMCAANTGHGFAAAA